jgi:hypothetical protein
LARSRPSARGALIAALGTAAARYEPDARRDKLALLARLDRARVPSGAAIRRLHETLCFLLAHPDDARVLARADAALRAFPARVAALSPRERRRLADTGIVGSALEYPFGLPMVRWLTARFPDEVDVAWERVDDEALEEALALLVSRPEGDAFTEGGIGWRTWLDAARAGRPVSRLRVLVELFDGAALPAEARDWVFERIALPITWTPRTFAGSRTGARRAGPRPFFHRRGLRRSGVDAAREARAPLDTVRRAPRAEALRLVDAARLAMAARQRELHCFSYPNPDDVLVADVGRGLRVVLVGLPAEHRQSLEGYYAFLVEKNGVPVSYGGAWGLFGTLEIGFNIFESFRQGESAFILSQVLRVYRHVTGLATFSVDPYQLGLGNPEALRSGAFYFYYRQGFRPHDAQTAALVAREERIRAAAPGHRSSLAVLARLCRRHVYLVLPGGDPAPERRVRPALVAALVSGLVAREFGGDRRAAAPALAARVARALGLPRRPPWPAAEWRAFQDLAPVAALVPDLSRWPARDRAALVALFRAKGGPTEAAYFRLLRRQHRLRDTLARLTADGPPT